jgi:hypothetical protein
MSEVGRKCGLLGQSMIQHRLQHRGLVALAGQIRSHLIRDEHRRGEIMLQPIPMMNMPNVQKSI